MDNKEYKVITSNTPVFTNPGKLKQVLGEEAEAGWDLEEVIDAHKIRVGRDKSARESDGNRSIDPYRISVGVNNVLYLGSAAVITILIVFVVIRLAAFSV